MLSRCVPVNSSTATISINIRSRFSCLNISYFGVSFLNSTFFVIMSSMSFSVSSCFSNAIFLMGSFSLASSIACSLFSSIGFTFICFLILASFIFLLMSSSSPKPILDSILVFVFKFA